jgi:hypothetical protein
VGRRVSLFHVVLPVTLVWSIRRVGYDRRAPVLQLGIAVLALLASRAMGPAENLNFAFADPVSGRSWGPAPVHLAVMLAALAVIYAMTHSVLCRIRPPAGPR